MNTKRGYMPRIADEILVRKLRSKGAVLITGPKWCGKTTTASRAASSAVCMKDPEQGDQNAMLAVAAPKRFLAGDTPRLIDEWQLAPSIWDSVRSEVDRRGEFGQFILTGLATPAGTSRIAHSGIGRITRISMRPMTLFESGDSSGQVSLKALFDGSAEVEGETDKGVEEIAFLVARGGWPRAVGSSNRVALQQAVDYLDNLVSMDYRSVDGVRRSKSSMRRLLSSCSRHISTEASLNVISADIAASEGGSMSSETVSSYLNALRALSVVEDVEAWTPSLRSKTPIRTSSTRHFADPSIACAALGASPDDLMDDLKTLGSLFESMCVRDIRTYAERLGGEVLHYRDKKNKEVDIVVRLRDGRYGLVETELSSGERIDKSAETLCAVRDNLNTEAMGEPSFLMVVTSARYAYTRPDGVIVVPLATLAP